MTYRLYNISDDKFITHMIFPTFIETFFYPYARHFAFTFKVFVKLLVEKVSSGGLHFLEEFYVFLKNGHCRCPYTEVVLILDLKF